MGRDGETATGPTAPARRRGFVMVEMIVALGLMALLMNLSVGLLVGIFNTTRQVEIDERTATAAEQATLLLRRDVERATSVAADGASVTLGPVTWSADGDTLERREAGRTLRLAQLPSPAISADAGVVTLRLGQATWALRPLLPTTEARP